MPIPDPANNVIAWTDDQYVSIADTFDSWRKKTNGLKPYIDGQFSSVDSSVTTIFEKTGGFPTTQGTGNTVLWQTVNTQGGGNYNGTSYDWTKFRRLGFHCGITNVGTNQTGAYLEIPTAVLKRSTNEVFTVVIPYAESTTTEHAGDRVCTLSFKYVNNVNTSLQVSINGYTTSTRWPVIYFIYGIN